MKNQKPQKRTPKKTTPVSSYDGFCKWLDDNFKLLSETARYAIKAKVNQQRRDAFEHALDIAAEQAAGESL